VGQPADLAGDYDLGAQRTATIWLYEAVLGPASPYF
jgi:hypothetical protein